jgi:hypothetical protein
MSETHLSVRQFRQFREREARVAAWQKRARLLLAEVWPVDTQQPSDVDQLADTIVGMFDAGARDEEVIAFLREAEIRHFGEERLDVARRQTLAHLLHRAAADADV